MDIKRKGCPLLVQSDTNPSLTVRGQSWTRAYMLPCIGSKCAAFCVKKGLRGYCKQFDTYLATYDNVEESGDG